MISWSQKSDPNSWEDPVKTPREDWNTVVADDLRPAGDGKHCFYCSAILGDPHDQGCVIPRHAGWYHVAIRKNATGEIRMYRRDLGWDNDRYIWTDGNYGCDCNRHLFFERTGGREPPHDELRCGATAYAALYAELPDGRRIEIQSSDQPKADP